MHQTSRTRRGAVSNRIRHLVSNEYQRTFGLRPHPDSQVVVVLPLVSLGRRWGAVEGPTDVQKPYCLADRHEHLAILRPSRIAADVLHHLQTVDPDLDRAVTPRAVLERARRHLDLPQMIVAVVHVADRIARGAVQVLEIPE